MKVTCAVCHKKVDAKEALLTKNEQGEEMIICRNCFKQKAGVDYETFSYRKQNAKQLALAVVLCICMTGYAWWNRGPLYGAMGIILTILVYYFGCKLKR